MLKNLLKFRRYIKGIRACVMRFINDAQYRNIVEFGTRCFGHHGGSWLDGGPKLKHVLVQTLPKLYGHAQKSSCHGRRVWVASSLKLKHVLVQTLPKLYGHDKMTFVPWVRREVKITRHANS